MGKFLNGLLLGVGIGVLVAPKKGNEMRQMVGERVGKVKGSLPENWQNIRPSTLIGRSGSQVIKNVEEYYKPEPTAKSSVSVGAPATESIRTPNPPNPSSPRPASPDVRPTGPGIPGTTVRPEGPSTGQNFGDATRPGSIETSRQNPRPDRQGQSGNSSNS